MKALRVAGKVLLVLVTLLFLASMGGGMAYVWWLLVPLHWMAAKRSGPWGTAGWALLAAASVSEVAWMTLYVVSGHNEAVAAVTMPIAFAVTALAFVWAQSSKTMRSSPSPGS